MKPSLLLLCAAAMMGSPAFGAALPEPETVFYGKILNRFGPVDYTMTEGTLTWVLGNPDGSALILNAPLQPLADGEYSYRLNVPHQALSLGLQTSGSVIGLRTVPEAHTHLGITVDGYPTTILAPGSYSFDAAQALRAATYRLDLAVWYQMPDTDGDGMPDWWEDRFGLDSQVNDANGDLDGDGVRNLAEYDRDGDPTHDDRLPKLTTTAIVAFAGRTTGVLLQTSDADTSPFGLVYTLTAAPLSGDLQLEGRSISAGATFTQADIHRGRLTFSDASRALSGAGEFSVSVSDGTSGHPPAAGRILVNPYQPSASMMAGTSADEIEALVSQTGTLPDVVRGEDLRMRGYLLGAVMPLTVWDQTANRSDYALDVSQASSAQFFMGGEGDETFQGTAANDWIAGGPGADRLMGLQGADRFVLGSPLDGNDTLVDYNPSEGDALDFCRLLSGASSLLSDYVQLRRDGSDCVVGVDVNGDGSGFNDLEVRLEGSALAASDLHDLWDNGNLLTDGLRLRPRVTLEATVASASENDSSPGLLTITRTGPLDAPLAVRLQYSGTATRGIDFAMLPDIVVLSTGERVVTLTISPYEDVLTESTEVVDVALLADPAYELAGAASAQVTIEDLKPQITVEAVQPIAFTQTGQPAVFLISRSGVLDRSVFVRLTLSGTAANGSDYQTVFAFVNLQASETSKLIEIRPTSTAVLSGGVESVVLTLRPDPSYRVGTPSGARALIAEEQLSLARWRNQHFPESTGDLSAFARSDPGEFGIASVTRYALGLDPYRPGSDPTTLPRMDVVEGHLTLTFSKELAATDVEYLVEVSTDLDQWQSGAEAVEDVTPILSNENPKTSVYRARASSAEANPLFIRLRVIHTP